MSPKCLFTAGSFGLIPNKVQILLLVLCLLIFFLPLTGCRNGCPLQCPTSWMCLFASWWCHLTCSSKPFNLHLMEFSSRACILNRGDIGSFTLFLFPLDLVFLFHYSPPILCRQNPFLPLKVFYRSYFFATKLWTDVVHC